MRRLVESQFPAWADLEITPVANGGWDNRTFHLGPSMSVRLPSAAHYAPQVEKEQTWLPELAPALPLPIPAPLARGAPGEGYPWSWSVCRWLPGEVAAHGRVRDLDVFARDLATFLLGLQAIDAAGGPPAGAHSFFRGGDLAVYDAETRRSAAALAGTLDEAAVLEVWAAALGSRWSGSPVWVHGDVAPGNLLVEDGRLCAVIDFGCCAVGDPACDLAIAWTFLDEPARRTFRETLGVDEATWQRGRGWTLWKAMLEIRRLTRSDPAAADRWRATLADVLSGR
ncbi:MAG: aminoglycoside phosphotransferase family protein [Pseudomonadales bacterium]